MLNGTTVLAMERSNTGATRFLTIVNIPTYSLNSDSASGKAVGKLVDLPR